MTRTGPAKACCLRRACPSVWSVRPPRSEPSQRSEQRVARRRVLDQVAASAGDEVGGGDQGDRERRGEDPDPAVGHGADREDDHEQHQVLPETVVDDLVVARAHRVGQTHLAVDHEGEHVEPDGREQHAADDGQGGEPDQDDQHERRPEEAPETVHAGEHVADVGRAPVADAADDHAVEPRGQRTGQDAQRDDRQDAGDEAADEQRDDVGGEGVPGALECEPDVETGSCECGCGGVHGHDGFLSPWMRWPEESLRPRSPPVVTRRAEPGVNCGRNRGAGGLPLRGDAAGAGGRGRPGSGSESALAQNDIRYVSGQMLGPMPRLIALAASWIWDQPS